MSWSISQVARMSKVTSRTLRHYDEIGLLPPVAVEHSGRRRYGRAELVRLQQILLLRELGLPLEAIGRMLDGSEPEVDALRRHHLWLRAEQARLGRLADTVERTLAQLEGGAEMAPEEYFEGFDAQKQAGYEAELLERYGPGIQPDIDESKRRMRGMSRADAQATQAEWTALESSVVALIDAGVAPGDERALALFAGHFAWISRFWTPNRESYAGLGQLYADSPGFRAKFDAVDPRLAEYLRDGIAAYAAARL